ncbi:MULTISPECIES: hypothetical protein [unclassified Sphingobium]|uniref:hypothetical protein n=2 Tax=unclassified Sphingobium TaxID=2611147 RepID=UPI0011A0544B|nr:hypothetical protein [Sphingobium sp. AEW001]
MQEYLGGTMNRIGLLAASALICSLSTAAAASETISYLYDALGRMVASVADSGPTAKATSMYRYDAANNRNYVGVVKADGTQIPVFRFQQNWRHFYTVDYLEGSNAGLQPEWIAFSLYPGGGSGLIALYRCYQSGSDDHFVSMSSTCEGQVQEGLMGYAHTTPGPGRRALYRFYKASIADHLITVDSSEGTSNGYTSEGILGYVI